MSDSAPVEISFGLHHALQQIAADLWWLVIGFAVLSAMLYAVPPVLADLRRLAAFPRAGGRFPNAWTRRKAERRRP